METNGHTNGTHAPAAAVKPATLIVIRVFRIDKGTTQYVRMLSPEYGGVFTHYVRGRSQYCHGRDCPSPAHKIDRVWKGYAAAQVWNAASSTWFPVCLEITESLELTMRGVYARGQVWELYREIGPKGKELPVEGKLLEERDVATMPKPFDIVPCLRALFHIDSVDLSSLNPLPPRVVIEASRDAGPEALKPRSSIDPAATQSFDLDAFRKQQKAAATGKKSPTDKKPAYQR